MASSQDGPARKELTKAIERETKVEKNRRKNRWSGNYHFYGWWSRWQITTIEEQKQKLGQAYVASLPARFRWFVAKERIQFDVKPPKLERWSANMCV